MYLLSTVLGPEWFDFVNINSFNLLYTYPYSNRSSNITYYQSRKL